MYIVDIQLLTHHIIILLY